jgi:hypothetical protein
MDEKEKWALAYDKGAKSCAYMTSNMAEIFNSILRGVQPLSLTAIASFTFYKCNEWFVKWLVDAQMVQTHHSNYVVTPNTYLNTKRYEAHTQGIHATCFDIQARKYEVLGGGGMTSGGGHRGAKQFTVNLSEKTCIYGVPQLIHVPCPHIIFVCNRLGRNFYMPPFMATYNTLESLVCTWSPRFVPFLDEEQLEPYDSPRYVDDKAMMWKKRGPKRRARYAMEMDRVKLGRLKRSKVNSESMEDRHEICYSKCHKAGHN